MKYNNIVPSMLTVNLVRQHLTFAYILKQLSRFHQWQREGGMRPGRHCAGAAFWGGQTTVCRALWQCFRSQRWKTGEPSISCHNAPDCSKLCLKFPNFPGGDIPGPPSLGRGTPPPQTPPHRGPHFSECTRASEVLIRHCGQVELPRISAWTLYFQKLESLAYIFAADSMGLSSFKFVQWAAKNASILQQSAGRKRIITSNSHSRSFILQSVIGWQGTAYTAI